MSNAGFAVEIASGALATSGVGLRHDDDDASHARALLGQPAQPNHIVQFYESDEFLCDNVAHFLGAGIGAGEPVVVIATPAHRAAFVARLKQNAIDVDRAIASKQLALLDARETLTSFMVGDAPDFRQFVERVGSIVAELAARRAGARVRAYGEMVDLLWRDGRQQAAIRLEEMWNQLATTHSFSLLCAYVMGNFYNEAHAEQFREICSTHTHVIPTERYFSTPDHDARMRQISALQQRARALETEIDNRKLLEASLRESLEREKAAREEAERTVRFNEIFAGILGHDLRNPLSAIMTGANYITRMSTGEKETRAATRILSSADRMARMIDQLLDFTRIRVGGGLSLHRTRTELGDLCYRVKDELEAAHPECSIALTTHGDTFGAWDHDRLMQVFSNLVGNAVQHGAAGGQVTIEVDGGDAAVVTVDVHNHGVVPPDLLPALFEPFRSTSKHHNSRGLGLGLFITQQIVLAHRGVIDVASTPGQGTTFRLRLPRGLET